MKRILIINKETGNVYIRDFDSREYDENDIEDIQRYFNDIDDDLDIDDVIFVIHEKFNLQIF